MARYRKIDTRTWNDKKFNKLSDDGKLVFFLLLSHPHLTPIGAMRATLAGLASELHWIEERFKHALEECSCRDMVRIDHSSALIWLPNFLKYNQPESPNVVRSWDQYLDYLPECLLKDELIESIFRYVKTLSITFQEALPEAFKKAIPNQEQEQDQEQKQEKINPSVKTDVNFSSNQFRSEAIEILEFLNKKAARNYRPVDANLKLIIARLKSGIAPAQCYQVIAKKTREWMGNPKMDEYLRPVTLFNPSKFEQYVGELVIKEENT